MSIQLPRWKCSDLDLEEALNTLAAAVEQALNKRFHAGVNMDITQDEHDVIFEGNAGGEGGDIYAHPFRVVAASDPAIPPPDPPEVGWVKVILSSTLLASIRPDDKVTITGLDYPLQLEITDNPRQYIWLEVDIRPINDTPPTARLASIKSGEDWNGEDGDFWPHPIRFDTDDGTPTGSDPENTPANRIQTHFYVPIAYTITHNPQDIYELPGIMLSSTVKLIQQLTTQLVIARTCYRGDDVEYVLPFHSWFTLPD